MTLAQVTRETRLILKVGAFLCVTLFFLFLLVRGGVLLKQILFPPPPTPPEEKFGKLPSLNFSSANASLEYEINTVDGNLPSFPDRTIVYKIIHETPDINALVDAETKMQNFGFTSNQRKSSGSETQYVWTNPTLGADITYDIVSNNFTIASSVLANPASLTFTPLEDPSTIKGNIQSTLGNIPEDISDIDITNNNSTVTYYKFVGTQRILTTTPQDAQVAVVNLVQSNVPVQPFTRTGDPSPTTTLPILYSKPDEANINFTAISLNNSLALVAGEYYHYVVDKDTHSTYPIKTSQAAYEDLKNGKAVVFYQGNNQKIQITDISLAFYMAKDSPQYLLPIYVFKGNDFTAYVQAIADTSVGN